MLFIPLAPLRYPKCSPILVEEGVAAYRCGLNFLPVGVDVLDDPKTIRFSLRIGVSMRFDFLPVGVDVLDDPKTIRFSLRIGVLMRFEFLPVGTGVLDCPRRKSVCFTCGYIPIAV